MEIGDLRTETKKNKSESVFCGNILIKHSKKSFRLLYLYLILQPPGSFPLSLSGNTFAHGFIWNSGYVLVRSLRLHIMIQNTAAIRLYIRSDPKPETGNGIGRWCRDLVLSTFVECNSIGSQSQLIIKERSKFRVSVF